MTTLRELRDKFDGRGIEEIEKIASDAKEMSIETRREFIEALYYLRHTKRFREVRLYETATFAEYIRGRYMMTETQFDNERIAYIQFPHEAAKFGPGVVARVVKRCGAIGAGKVFLEARVEAVKTVGKLEQKIEKHAKPTPPAVKKTDAKMADPMVERKADAARAIIQAQSKTIEEQERQIAKLKNTVARLKKENAELVATLEKRAAILQSYASELGVVGIIQGSSLSGNEQASMV